MEKYGSYSDEQLAVLYQQGNLEVVEILLEKYRPLVKKNTNKMFLIGAEKDDLDQEGMIGLFKAIRDYSPEEGASFFTFADLCISRQMITAYEKSNRKKHSPLNSYISISADKSEGGIPIEEIMKGESQSPEDLFIQKEVWQELRRKLEDILSPMERQVLTYYLDGKNYTEIAEVLEKEPKAVDNAIQRIRSKVRNISM